MSGVETMSRPCRSTTMRGTGVGGQLHHVCHRPTEPIRSNRFRTFVRAGSGGSTATGVDSVNVGAHSGRIMGVSVSVEVGFLKSWEVYESEEIILRVRAELQWMYVV